MGDKFFALSARKLKPGTWEKFREAWDVKNYEGGEHPPFIDRIVHLRSTKDPDYVISFGEASGDPAEIQGIMNEDKWRNLDAQRQSAMKEFVEETYVDGIFALEEEIVPANV